MRPFVPAMQLHQLMVLYFACPGIHYLIQWNQLLKREWIYTSFTLRNMEGWFCNFMHVLDTGFSYNLLNVIFLIEDLYQLPAFASFLPHFIYIISNVQLERTINDVVKRQHCACFLFVPCRISNFMLIIIV